MVKKIGIFTKSNISFYRVKKTTKPMVRINGHMYCILDKICVAQDDDDVHLALYNIDSTQPLGHGTFLSPSLIKTYMNSMKSVGKKPSAFSDFSLTKLIPVIVLICLGMSALYVFMR